MTHEEVMEQAGKAIKEIVRKRKILDFEEYCVGFEDYGIEKEILSIPEILIKDPNQSLPSNNDIPSKKYPDEAIQRTGLMVWNYAMNKMLKENWVKVVREKGDD